LAFLEKIRYLALLYKEEEEEASTSAHKVLAKYNLSDKKD